MDELREGLRHRFAEAVTEMQPRFAGTANESFLLDPQRCAEASAVALPVERVVLGEMDPDGRRALGRLTKFSPPALANYLSVKRRFTPGDPGQEAVLTRAARKVLALGWLFAATPETRIADRSDREIWDVWAGPSLRDDLHAVVPRDLARLIHNNGADLLVGDLKEAGMTRLLGGSKLRQIGFQIVQNGFYLRLTQTNEMADEVFSGALAQRRRLGAGFAGGRWDWEAYRDQELVALA